MTADELEAYNATRARVANQRNAFEQRLAAARLKAARLGRGGVD